MAKSYGERIPNYLLQGGLVRNRSRQIVDKKRFEVK